MLSGDATTSSRPWRFCMAFSVFFWSLLEFADWICEPKGIGLVVELRKLGLSLRIWLGLRNVQ